MLVQLAERQPLPLDIGEGLFINVLEAAGDEPVLWLARVELPRSGRPTVSGDR
jgi:hypothetical protein